MKPLDTIGCVLKHLTMELSTPCRLAAAVCWLLVVLASTGTAPAAAAAATAAATAAAATAPKDTILLVPGLAMSVLHEVRA